MTQILRQSTQIIVRIGPAVAVADGFTPVTSLTLAGADEAELLKGNSSTTVDISGATMAAITGCDGWYALTLTTSHTDTVGALDVMINDDSLILPIFARFQVIEEAVYDALYAASATGAMPVSSGGIAASAFAAGAIDAAALAADAGTELGTAVWASATRTLTALDEDATTLDLDATIRAALGLASANVDTQLSGIQSDTNDIQTRLPAALVSGRIDANVGAMSTGVLGAAALASDAVAEIADGVWDEVMSGHTTVGTFGQRLQDIRTGTAQTGAATTITLDSGASASDDFYNNCLIVITSGQGANQARFISDYDGATQVATVNAAWVGSNPNNTSVFMIVPFGSLPGATAPTAAEVADAVWDEDATAHQTQGTFGQAIGDPGSDPDTIWALANTNLNATVSSRASQTSVDTIDDFLDTEIAALVTATGAAAIRTALGLASANLDTQLAGLLADTDNIQSRLPTTLVSGRMDSSVGAMAANTLTASALAADAVSEIQSGLSTLTSAQVNAEVLDVLNVDTFSEPGQGAFPAAPTMRQMMHYRYKMDRNRLTQTSSQLSLYADNGTTLDTKWAVTDNGTTLDRAESVTGP